MSTCITSACRSGCHPEWLSSLSAAWLHCLPSSVFWAKKHKSAKRSCSLHFWCSSRFTSSVSVISGGLPLFSATRHLKLEPRSCFSQALELRHTFITKPQHLLTFQLVTTTLKLCLLSLCDIALKSGYKLTAHGDRFDVRITDNIAQPVC